jgi:hypothetical protein
MSVTDINVKFDVCNFLLQWIPRRWYKQSHNIFLHMYVYSYLQKHYIHNVMILGVWL